MGIIELDHEIDLKNTLLQFMNDSVIIELVKMEE